MKKIQKFKLPPKTRCYLYLPRKSELLGVSAYNDLPYVYALVDDEMPETEQFDFIIKCADEEFTKEEEEWAGGRFKFLGSLVLKDIVMWVWGK